ncbi:DUF5808 domain-containing protein [Cohnella panacarvi]|uniref:DUF5808 domain-containing protein n=1 Tax=Cohnella panacarvi TaxID=400776 RepID=UPI00047BC08A|nr:DUF5808 domain-containing protein [Cohnella panacarvi]
MLIIVLLLPAIILYGAILAIYKPQSKGKNGIVFGIALPPGAEENGELQAIRQRYDKQFSRISIWTLAALVPFPFMYDWFGMLFIYYLGWIFAFIFVAVIPFRQAFRDTLALKKSHGWGSEDDDDESWKNGFTYHNPSNKRFLVPKRIGVGMTVNTGTLAGQIFVWGLCGAVAALLGFVCFMIVRAELTSPVLTITSEQRVQIDYPMYAYDFEIADIQELSLIDRLPSGSKTNGEATGKYARGHFRMKELGKTRLYIFKDHPPYIRIKLEDGYVIYNDKVPAKTRQLYDSLQQEVGGSR